MCNALASKVLKQRPGTVQRAKDVYLMFCELEQAESVVVGLVSLAHLVIPACQKLSELPALAQESAVKAFADRVPKVVVAAADVLHTALRQESILTRCWHVVKSNVSTSSLVVQLVWCESHITSAHTEGLAQAV